MVGRKIYFSILLTIFLAAVVARYGRFSWTSDTHAQTTPPATLVQTIDTSAWSPPAPDPAGIAYLPASSTFLVADSEVDEMANLFTGKNVFETTAGGTLSATFSTTAFSNEPTGVAKHPVSGHIFYSDDNKKKIFEINLGADGIYGTGDDSVTSFSTSAFGSNDPEGISVVADAIFIADGAGSEVFTVTPGTNGIYDGVAPAGDDQVTHFDTSTMSQPDPEGIEYNADHGTLYLVSNNGNRTPNWLTEVTSEGTVIAQIDISFLGARSTAGLAYGPRSDDPSSKSIYIAARGVDNNSDPNENDGKIYEIAIGDTPPATPSPAPSPEVSPSPASSATPLPSPSSTPEATPSPSPVATPPPAPVTVNLVPMADATVRSSSPNTNFGMATTLEVDGKPIKVVYMKYNLTELTGKQILSATLRLRITNGSSNTQVIKQVTDTGWQEAAITYNNRPQLSTTITSFVGGGAGKWKEVDVTQAAAAHAGQLFSIGIDSSGGNGLDFYSKDNTGDKPQLVVSYQ